MSPTSKRTLDGISRPVAPTKLTGGPLARTPPKPASRPVPTARTWRYNARRSQLTSRPKKTAMAPDGRSRLTVIILILLLVVSGVLLRFAAASEILIGAYAVVAFMRHIESRVTFALALSAFACVILSLLLRPTHALAETFAEYAFLLLIVGTISLVIETRRMGSRFVP